MKIGRFIKRAFLTLAFAIAADAGFRAVTHPSRPLDAEEMEMVEPIFGKTIDYSKVRISDHPVSSIFLLVPELRMTLHNTIYCAKGKHTLDEQLVHEMMHIYQYQHDVKNTGATGAIALWFKLPFQYNKKAYVYTRDTTKNLLDYNMEQQGDIVKDYYDRVKRMNDAVTALQKKNAKDYTPLYLIDNVENEERQLRKIVGTVLPQANDDNLIARYDHALRTRDKIIAHNAKWVKGKNIPEKLSRIASAFGTTEQYDGGGEESCYVHDVRLPGKPDSTTVHLTFESYSRPNPLKNGAIEYNYQITYKGETVYNNVNGDVDFYKPGLWELKMNELYKTAGKIPPPQLDTAAYLIPKPFKL